MKRNKQDKTFTALALVDQCQSNHNRWYHPPQLPTPDGNCSLVDWVLCIGS